LQGRGGARRHFSRYVKHSGLSLPSVELGKGSLFIAGREEEDARYLTPNFPLANYR